MTALDQAWGEWMKPTGADGKVSQGERWRLDNPGQWNELKAYRKNGGTAPSLTGNTGRQMVHETTAWWAEQETPPVEPPTTGIEPPREPIERITNDPDLGVNVTTKQDVHDKIIDGTGDSGILFQKDAHGSSAKRIVMKRVGELNAVSYGKHAIYGKARDLLMEDIEAHCSSKCASGFSLRFDGAILRDSSIEGASHAISYYETSSVRGQVLVERVTGSFTGDTAIWMDAEVDYQNQIYQSFIFRGVKFTGKSGAAFLKIAPNRLQGSIRLEGCTLNGQPVTKAMCPNVPNLTIV